jgi:hypothetical protein
LNDICRNSLLGNRKKIAKFLMITFTCRSTFLYDSKQELELKQTTHSRHEAVQTYLVVELGIFWINI